eukprot:8140130-Prorocentrum_lima.AAC.1
MEALKEEVTLKRRFAHSHAIGVFPVTPLHLPIVMVVTCASFSKILFGASRDAPESHADHNQCPNLG